MLSGRNRRRGCWSWRRSWRNTGRYTACSLGGEKAAREVLLLKKSGENEKISQTVRTILETKATPEEMVPDIMELAMEGKYS